MPGKAKSGDTPSTGPDWTDVATTMRAIESTHSATLVLLIYPEGGKYGGSVAVELKATLPVLTGPARPLQYSICWIWPSVRAKTMEGLVYHMLLQMDHRIGSEAYKQAPLPAFPPE